MDSGVLPLEEPNGSCSRRFPSDTFKRRANALQILEIPQQNERGKKEHRPNEIEGLHTALDVVRREIVNVQHEAEKLSSNIVAAQQEFLQLVSQIKKCVPEHTKDAKHLPDRRFSSLRICSESIFSSCSTGKSGSTNSGGPGRGSRVQRELLKMPSEISSNSTKQGWLWKTPLTSNNKSLKSWWTRRWFYLKGFLLSYYRVKESLTSPEMNIQSKEPRRIFDLSSRNTVIRNPHWDDLGKKVHDARKFAPDGDAFVGDDPSSFLGFLIFVQIPEGKLCLQAETTEVAASWLSLFSRRLMQTSYVEKAQVSHMQPDKTVLKLLENPNVEHWDFKDCADTESLLIGLSDLLPSCSSVKSLSLANCKLGDKEMSKIQGHLATMSMSLKVALERLDFSENMIRAKSASGLGLAISESSTLQELLLDHNQLSDRGLEILARNIWETGRPITAALQKLSVVDNGITDKGVHTLADIIGKAPPPIGLKALHIGENKICDQGAAIMKISKALPSIAVDLQSNLSGGEIVLAQPKASFPCARIIK